MARPKFPSIEPILLPRDREFPDQIRVLVPSIEAGYEYADKHRLGDPLVIQNRGKRGIEFSWSDPSSRKITVEECNKAALAMHGRLVTRIQDEAKARLDEANSRLRKSNEMYVAAVNERNATVKRLMEQCEAAKRKKWW